MGNPIRFYRILCWLGAFTTAVAAVACLLVYQRLDQLTRVMAAHQCLPEPHEASGYRDQDFEFVIRNYGFEYEGRTSDLIDDHILFCGLWEKEVAFFMRDYLQQRANENAVFIDIEGFEEFALQGLQRTLEKHRPVMVLEVTRPPDGTIASLAELQSLFPEGYQFLVFMPGERTCFDGRYSLLRFEPVADQFFGGGRQVNLVAYPLEKSTSVPRESRNGPPAVD